MKMATCHPDRTDRGKGKCQSCYMKEYRQQKKAESVEIKAPPDKWAQRTDGRGYMVRSSDKVWLGDIMPLGKAVKLYPPGQGVIDPSGNTVFLFASNDEEESVSVLRPHWTGRWRIARQPGDGPGGRPIACRLDIEEWSAYVLVRPSGGFYRNGGQVKGHANGMIDPVWVCEGLELPGQLRERQRNDVPPRKR